MNESSMRSWHKIAVVVGMLMIAWCIAISMALAYEENNAGKAAVEGEITFKGMLPPPKTFELAKYSQSDYCGKVDNDGKGNRLLREVTVNNGHLQDVVVYIQNITKGKTFLFNGTDVRIDHCRFLVQGGPSTFVGVVVDGREIRILNDDANPSDPKTISGVLHNPHGHTVTVKGKTWHTMFSKPVVNKGQVLRVQVELKKPNSVMHLGCDSHQYEQAWFYPVENPYYAIVSSDGTYSIDQVPPGKYKIVAWHPTLGVQEKEIEVGATGRVTVNFEFSEPTGHAK
jgi:hypothetical protein